VVAVDVRSGLKPIENCDTAFDVMMRMDEVGESLFRKHVREAADVVITPDVSHVEWFDFSAAKQLVESGRKATQSLLPTIKKMAAS
jgi:NTE family protein